MDLAGLDAAAAQFSGVVTVDVGERQVLGRAFGFAHRALGVPNSLDTAFGIASGCKGFTALVVMRLVEDGVLSLDRQVREILGDDLPLIDDRTTVEHLLTHTSGIGDYLDEETLGDANDYVMPVPTHTLTTSQAYLLALDGHPQKFEPGARFAYCNSGYVVLAILVERVTGDEFLDVVQRLVLDPAGMTDSGYFRMDELPSHAATGYLDAVGDRSNVLHLPVRGSGDGGAFTTAADLHRFWRALFAGRIVASSTVEQMIRPRFDVPDEGLRYGMGLWLHATDDAVILEGSDAGVSFRTTHVPETGLTVSVLGNTTHGAWPVVRVLAEALPSLADEPA